MNIQPAHSWLLIHPPASGYPKIDYYGFEHDPDYNYPTAPDLLQKHVYHQAGLDQMGNVTLGAAVNPAWYAVKTSGYQSDSN